MDASNSAPRAFRRPSLEFEDPEYEPLTAGTVKGHLFGRRPRLVRWTEAEGHGGRHHVVPREPRPARVDRCVELPLVCGAEVGRYLSEHLDVERAEEAGEAVR